MAVRVGLTEPAPILRVALAPLVRLLAPAKVVVTVIVPALVIVLLTVSVAVVKVPLFCWEPPLTVTAVNAFAKVPLIVFEAPESVYVPVPGLNVPLLVKLPGKVNDTFAAVLLKVPFKLMVRSPLKALVPVPALAFKVKVPVTEVVPVTVRA